MTSQCMASPKPIIKPLSQLDADDNSPSVSLEEHRPFKEEQDLATYAARLRQCRDAKWGRQLHARIVKVGHDREPFLGNLLVQMYGKCGRMEDACLAFDNICQPNLFSWAVLLGAHVRNGHLQEARGVFDAMPQRDVVSWNAMIGAYAQFGYSKEALHLYRRMDSEGFKPDTVTFLAIIGACAKQASLAEGKAIHKIVVDKGYHLELKVGNALVSMYGKCGSLEDARSTFDSMPELNVITWTSMIAVYAQNGHLVEARKIFDDMPIRNVVSWNSMVAAYAQHAQHRDALELYYTMNLQGVKATEITFICILEAISSLGTLEAGKLIHATVVVSGLISEVIVQNALVNMYGKCGKVEVARDMFERIAHRDITSWNVMISMYAQNDAKQGLAMYRRMNMEGVKPNTITFVSMLDACANLTDLVEGMLIHDRIVSTGFLNTSVVLDTALVSMYGKCGNLLHARRVFDNMSRRDVVCWSAMVAAYAQNEHKKEALQTFAMADLEGIMPNAVIFVSALDACADLASLKQAKLIHAAIEDCGFQSHSAVATALVHAYATCGSSEDAIGAFRRGPQEDVVLWNAMITAYAQNGHVNQGLLLFQEMGVEGVKPNEITLVGILCACSHGGLLHDGREYLRSMAGDYGVAPVHDHYACMVDLLGRSGRINEAEDLISNMPYEPDFVAWTSLLGACRIVTDKDRGARAAQHACVLDPENSGPYVLLSNMQGSGRDRDVKKQPGRRNRVHNFEIR